jgi:hypothetical protein
MSIIYTLEDLLRQYTKNVCTQLTLTRKQLQIKIKLLNTCFFYPLFLYTEVYPGILVHYLYTSIPEITNSLPSNNQLYKTTSTTEVISIKVGKHKK